MTSLNAQIASNSRDPSLITFYRSSTTIKLSAASSTSLSSSNGQQLDQQQKYYYYKCCTSLKELHIYEPRITINQLLLYLPPQLNTFTAILDNNTFNLWLQGKLGLFEEFADRLHLLNNLDISIKDSNTPNRSMNNDPTIETKHFNKFIGLLAGENPQLKCHLDWNLVQIEEETSNNRATALKPLILVL